MPETPPLRLRSLDYSVLQQCIHCGMCLPSCPTYDTTKREKNSPRGRIALMRAVADGELEPSRAFAEEMRYCLGCLACQSACPADVDYARMFEAARADIEDRRLLDSRTRSFWRALLLKNVFMKPRRLCLLGRLLGACQRSGLQRLARRAGLTRLLGKTLRELEPMAPDIRPRFSDALVAAVERPASGEPRYRVGLLTGCVQDLAFSDVNRDTTDVLLANGCEVVTPRCQSCCGSLHAHNGETELARELARRTIDSFELESLDAVISNAGGCGSHLKHYGRLLSDDSEYAERARQWDAKLKDVHQWIADIGLQPPGPLPEPLVATYHPSCHLHHGQGVKTQPAQLLRSIPNLELRELPEADWCCGSAGVYNITQPEEAKRLQERKAAHVRSTGCSVVATSNPGCHLQLQNGLKGEVAARHPMSLLAAAYRANRGSDRGFATGGR